MQEEPPEHAPAKRKKKGKCIVKYCQSLAYTKGRNLKCKKHLMREWRAKNKVPAIFATIRDRARRKGIEFSITLDQFRAFCAENGYPAKGMHLDRKRATEGYRLDNIQVLTANQNIVKGNVERHTPEYKEHIIQRKLFVKKTRQADVVAKPCVDVVADTVVDVVAGGQGDVVAELDEQNPF